LIKHLIAYFDGLCEPVNPGGVATYGFVIYSEQGGMVESGCGVAAVGYRGDYATNNVAEYWGALKALKALSMMGAERPVLRGDSKLVIKQLSGEWRVKSSKLKPLYVRAKELVDELGAVLEWVPRERNKEADRLSRKAFEGFVRRNLSEFRNAYRNYLPTDKQLALLRRLGLDVDLWLSRSKASKIIREALRRDEP